MDRVQEKKSLKDALDSGAMAQEQYDKMLRVENTRSWIKDDYVESAVAMASKQQ